MIEKINTNQIQDPLENSSSRLPNSAGPLPDSDVDALLQVDYASLINKAMQPPQTDTNAVQRAKELLLSSELESPQNIRAAAENIINFGV